MTTSEPSSPDDLARDKSGAVTALCVLGVIIGGIGICSPLLLLLPHDTTGPATQGVDLLRADRLVSNWTLAGYFVNFLLSVLLVSSAIGSMTLKPSARLGMVAWAMLALAVSIGWYFLSKNILEPRVDALMASQPPDLRPPASAKTIGNIKAGLAVGYELLVLFAFTRPSVIESFDHSAEHPSV